EVLQVGHPLHGEVLAAGVPRLRRRALLRDLVEAVGDDDGFDRLRLATWRLESGDPGDPEQLLGLARDAMGRLDHPLAERPAAAGAGPTPGSCWARRWPARAASPSRKPCWPPSSRPTPSRSPGWRWPGRPTCSSTSTGRPTPSPCCGWPTRTWPPIPSGGRSA